MKDSHQHQQLRMETKVYAHKHNDKRRQCRASVTRHCEKFDEFALVPRDLILSVEKNVNVYRSSINTIQHRLHQDNVQ